MVLEGQNLENLPTETLPLYGCGEFVIRDLSHTVPLQELHIGDC